MRMKLLLAVLAVLFALPCRAVDPALIKSLRQGGYILYMAPASVDLKQRDAATITNYDNCRAQRNLSDKGRGEARSIGEHAKRLGIPVGEVLASPYCRTTETAKLAFGKAERTQTVRSVEELRKIFATEPAKGTDLVIVSHTLPLNNEMRTLAPAEMMVVKPGGPSGYSVVGRIRADEWAKLRP